MSFELSVAICTHNPGQDIIARVLHALKAQTLEQDKWELIIIDNQSDVRLETVLDLDWHRHARVVREETLGTTYARLRAIQETQGSLIVFVDDDNILCRDYLSFTSGVSKEFPYLGAWGAGVIECEYEAAPPSWLKRHESRLAARRNAQAYWGNNMKDWQATPYGAGLTVRRQVAQLWFDSLAHDLMRRELGPRGDWVGSEEDNDLTLCSRHLNLGWGTFPELAITHLIPVWRTTFAYMNKLIEQRSYSRVLFVSTIDSSQDSLPRQRSRIAQCEMVLKIALKDGLMHARLWLSEQRGFKRGHRKINEMRMEKLPEKADRQTAAPSRHH